MGRLSLLVYVTLLLFLAACGGGGAGPISDAPSDPDPVPPAPPEPPPPPTFQLKPLTFEDVTVAAGITATHGGSLRIGQAWGDVDGDGWLDLYVTNTAGPDSLYMNQGDGTFVLAPIAWPDDDSSGALFVDYDNDGWTDLYVTKRYTSNALYRNNAGVLEDVTAAAGVGDPDGLGTCAAFGDYDNDGHLDLYVGNHNNDRPDVLYHNEGDGTFTVATAQLDVVPVGLCFSVSFVDYDNDGDADILVVNDARGGLGRRPWYRRNLLFRNDGPGPSGWLFTEVAEPAGAAAYVDGMGLAVGDVDLNGTLDFFISDSEQQVLLSNQGDGTFVDVSAATGTGILAFGWGAVCAEFDLDGWPDLYVATESGNLMLRNTGAGIFADVSENCGADDPNRSMGVAYADYDRDGDLDIVVGNSGSGYRLYRNMADPQVGWLSVRLVGAGPVNRDAVGTRVTITLSDGRTRMQEVKCGSSFGAGNDLALHFGFGTAEPVSMTIRWPDGTVETTTTVPVGTEVVRTYPTP